METIATAKNPPAIPWKRVIHLTGLLISKIFSLGRFLADIFSEDKISADLERERHASRNIIYMGMPGA